MLVLFCVVLTFTPGARLAPAASKSQCARGQGSHSQAVNILQPRSVVVSRPRACGIVAFEDGSDSDRPRTDKELSAIFYEFDTSGDGFIDVGELRAALAKAGKTVSMQEAKTILENVNTNGDGKISLEEFKAVFKMTPGSVPDVLKSFFDLFSIQGLISDLGVGGQWRRTEAGAKYLDDVVGDGKLVVPGDFVQMHYSITALSTGQVLETTRSGGIGRPLGYLVGTPDGKRTSWEDSVAGMRIGGRRRVYVASYKDKESEEPNLRFDLEIVALESASEAKKEEIIAKLGGRRSITRAFFALTFLPYFLPGDKLPGFMRWFFKPEAAVEADPLAAETKVDQVDENVAKYLDGLFPPK